VGCAHVRRVRGVACDVEFRSHSRYIAIYAYAYAIRLVRDKLIYDILQGICTVTSPPRPVVTSAGAPAGQLVYGGGGNRFARAAVGEDGLPEHIALEHPLHRVNAKEPETEREAAPFGAAEQALQRGSFCPSRM